MEMSASSSSNKYAFNPGAWYQHVQKKSDDDEEPDAIPPPTGGDQDDPIEDVVIDESAVDPIEDIESADKINAVTNAQIESLAIEYAATKAVQRSTLSASRSEKVQEDGNKRLLEYMNFLCNLRDREILNRSLD